MFLLLINHHPVTLQAGTSFKITRKNPALTDGGDYSLDLTLPLSGCPDNLRALTLPLHHFQQSLTTIPAKTYPFTLTADEFHLEGTARVTEIDETTAKLQLKAGTLTTPLGDESTTPAATLYSEDQYIDTLLSSSYFTTPTKISDHDAPNGTLSLLSRLLTPFDNPEEYIESSPYSYRGYTNGQLFVAYPIYSEADSIMANERQYALFPDPLNDGEWTFHSSFRLADRDLDNVEAFTYNPEPYTAEADGHYQILSSYTFAPQPYLYVILERALTLLGYTPYTDTNDPNAHDILLSDYRRRIFIANARSTTNLGFMLPHWTLKEFFQQVQNFLGILIHISGHTYRILNRWHTANTTTTDYIPLTQIENERTVEISDDYDDDITAYTGDAPLRYTLDTTNNYLQLQSSLTEYIGIDSTTYTTLAQLRAAKEKARKEADTDTLAQMRTTIYYLADERTYYIIHSPNDTTATPRRVGIYSPNNPTCTDEDTTPLKIVPARLTGIQDPVAKAYYYVSETTSPRLYRSGGDTTVQHGLYPLRPIPCLTTTDTTVAQSREKLTAYSIISGESEIENTTKPDRIEVALNPRMIQEQSPSQITYHDILPIQFVTDDPNLTITNKSKLYTAYPTATRVIEGYESLLYDDDTEFPASDYAPFRLEGNTPQSGLPYYQSPLTPFDTRVQSQYTFHDRLESGYDPTRIYLIRGIPHLCLQLELTLTPDHGLSPRKVGKFIPLA